MSSKIRVELSVMMFLQFFIWGCVVCQPGHVSRRTEIHRRRDGRCVQHHELGRGSGGAYYRHGGGCVLRAQVLGVLHTPHPPHGEGHGHGHGNRLYLAGFLAFLYKAGDDRGVPRDVLAGELDAVLMALEHLLDDDHDELAVLADETAEGDQGAAQALQGAPLAARLEAQLGEKVLVEFLEQPAGEGLLGAEMVVEQAEVDAGAPRDVAQAQPGDAGLREHRPRRIEEPAVRSGSRGSFHGVFHELHKCIIKLYTRIIVLSRAY